MVKSGFSAQHMWNFDKESAQLVLLLFQNLVHAVPMMMFWRITDGLVTLSIDGAYTNLSSLPFLPHHGSQR